MEVTKDMKVIFYSIYLVRRALSYDLLIPRKAGVEKAIRCVRLVADFNLPPIRASCRNRPPEIWQ